MDYVRELASPLETERTYYSVCLLSRSWHEAGQRALYSRPLMAREAEWWRAHALADTLGSQIGLGAQVRDLSMLGRRVAELGVNWNKGDKKKNKGRHSKKSAADKKPAFQGSRAIWADEIISSCPLYDTLEVPLGTAFRLRNVDLPRSLKKVSLYRVGKMQHVNAYTEVAEFIQRLPPLTVLRVVNFDGGFASNDVDFVNPAFDKLRLVAERIELDTSIEDYILAKTVFHPAVKCKQLSIRCRDLEEYSDARLNLDDIMKVVRPQLEHLSIDSVVSADKRQVGIQYYDHHEEHEIHLQPVPALFEPWPVLQRLELHFFAHLSFERIKSVILESPALDSVSLRDSIWSFPDDLGSSCHTFLTEPVMLQHIEALSGHIKQYHIGRLPVSSTNAEIPEQDAEDAREHGIELEFQTCADKRQRPPRRGLSAGLHNLMFYLTEDLDYGYGYSDEWHDEDEDEDDREFDPFTDELYDTDDEYISAIARGIY